MLDGDGRTRGHVLAEGQIRLPEGATLPERLLGIWSALEELVELHCPEELAVESVFFSKNARSSLVLGHARAVPLLLAARRGMRVYEYAPRVVKLAVTGSGSATKEQVQHMATRLLGLDGAAGPDAADALAVALCHIFRTSGPLRGRARGWRSLGATWRSRRFPGP